MLDIYNLLNKGKHIGIMIHDNKTDSIRDEFRARIDDTGNEPLWILAGLGEIEYPVYVSSEHMRFYFKSNVMPRNRENCRDVLDSLGIRAYDEWKIIQRYKGWNRKNYSMFKFIESIDGDIDEVIKSYELDAKEKKRKYNYTFTKKCNTLEQIIDNL